VRVQYNRHVSQPIFDPSSEFWRINRELAVGLAGPRAVLLQIAHPLIAAGVAEHSRFRRHRLSRLYRTSAAAAAITFGSRELATRAVRTIDRRHATVHGTLKEDTGVWPAGTPYDANDPKLKLWVLSTITDSALTVFDWFVSPLSPGEREAYYRDSLAAASLFGVPDELVPGSYVEFQDYMSRMLGGGSVSVGIQAREIADALFSPSVMGIVLRLASAAGIGLLPERIRREFGFRWGVRQDRWLERAGEVSRRVRRHMPGIVCASPAATLSEWMMPLRS
jgi:uncharacterized protein (DUF2236 family)